MSRSTPPSFFSPPHSHPATLSATEALGSEAAGELPVTAAGCVAGAASVTAPLGRVVGAIEIVAPLGCVLGAADETFVPTGRVVAGCVAGAYGALSSSIARRTKLRIALLSAVVTS